MPADCHNSEPASLLSISEAAARYRVSERTVRRHARVALRKFGARTLVDPVVLSEKLKIESVADNLGEPLEQSEGGIMLQRKRWGRGSVYLRRGKRGGVWYGRWWEDLATVDGELLRRYRKVRLGSATEIPNRTQARRELQQQMSNGSDNPVVGITFAELCDRWESVNRLTLKPSTFAHYRKSVAELKKSFNCSITAITRHACERYLLDKATRYSRSVVHSLQVVLSLVLGYAVNNDWLPKNPARGIRLPRTFGGKIVVRSTLEPEHVQKLVEALEEPYATLVDLLYQTGLRISEARELRWSDLVEGVMHVRGTKSKGADRQLPLSLALVTRLRRLPVEGEHVFHGRGGAPLNRQNWLRRYVSPAASRVGIRLGGWHDFRHGCSRRLRRDGVHPKLVSAVLGHSKVNLAMDVYDRATVEELRGVMQLNPIEPKSGAAA